jgi:TRAP-type C4-dicarboxylate transport system permease small subunit
MLQLLRWVDRYFEQAIIVICCTILVSCLSYSALVRYFVTHSFFTTLSHKAEELAVFAFVFLLYFGSVLATREQAHFRVSAHLDWIKPPLRRWRFVIGDAIWQAFNLFIVWQGLILVKSAFDRPEPSLSLQIPMQWIYMIIPVAFMLTAVRLVQSYLEPEPEHDPTKAQL